MALNELERRIVATIEESWMKNATLPYPRQIAESFGLTEKRASEILTSADVIGACESRGIPSSNAAGLNPEQVTAINTIINPMDTRSRRKKLQEMNISPAKWAGWQKQPKFMEYYSLRAHQLLSEAIPEAKMALVDNVLRGDLGSIKYLNEMTGEYSPDKQNVDLASITQKIIDILQVHIKDPEILLAVSQDLLGLAHGDTVRGEVVIHPTPVAEPLGILEM